MIDPITLALLPVTCSFIASGISTLVNSVVNANNAKLNSNTQKEISNTNIALQQERDTSQKEIEKIKLKQQDLLQERSLSVQKSENKLNRESHSEIARSNQQAQIELAELNHLSQRGENQLTREQNERLSELNRQAQVDLARFAQSFQHDENLLTREQNDRLAQLTRDFQANEGKLSREHLERLEIWRSSLQKELSDRSRNLQLDLKEIDAKLTWELRHFDRESARIRMREEKMLAQSPIWEAAKSILANDSNTPVPHLHIFVSPPILKYDTQVSPERNNVNIPDMEQYLNGRLREFFGDYSKHQRPIDYLGASAWMSKVFRGEAAARSIFDSLKSEPTIIIESSVEGEEIEINFAYWGLGYTYPAYFTGARFSWRELLFDFVRKRTLDWFDRREKAGEIESQWIDKYGEDVVKRYKHNHAIIERERNCLACGDDLSDIKRDYQVQQQDTDSLKNYLTVYHCFYAGILADDYFLSELSPTHRQPPLLPRLIANLIKNFRDEEQTIVLSQLLDAYRSFYGHLQSTESNWIPDLKLELAEAFMELPQQFGAMSLLKESLHALDSPLIAIDPNVEISTLLTSLKSKLSIGDLDYVERLNRSLDQLGIDEKIDLADCCYQRAIEYYRDGAARSSIIDFTYSITLRENLAAYYYRGLAYIQLQEYATAITDLTQVINSAAPDAIVDGFSLLGYAYEQRGLVHSKLRDYHTAIPDFDLALDLGVTTAAKEREIACRVLEELKIQEEAAELERQQLVELLRQEEERRIAEELERKRQEELLRQAERKRQAEIAAEQERAAQREREEKEDRLWQDALFRLQNLKFKNGKCTVLVLGDFNRGKSTFLNVLLGQNILPTKSIPCTAIPTIVRYGQHDDRVKVYYNNGTETEPMTAKEFQEKYGFNSELTKEQRGIITLECSSPLLANGIQFMDTPGLNHSEEQDRIVWDCITMSDVIILLLNAEQLVTTVERDYIDRLVFKSNINNVFFLINKWDLITKSDDDDEDDDPEEEIRDAFITGLSESLRITEEEVKKMWGKRIFGISAHAVSNKLNKNETLRNTGFPEFINSFAHFLENLER